MSETAIMHRLRERLVGAPRKRERSTALWLATPRDAAIHDRDSRVQALLDLTRVLTRSCHRALGVERGAQAAFAASKHATAHARTRTRARARVHAHTPLDLH